MKSFSKFLSRKINIEIEFYEDLSCSHDYQRQEELEEDIVTVSVRDNESLKMGSLRTEVS